MTDCSVGVALAVQPGVSPAPDAGQIFMLRLRTTTPDEAPQIFPESMEGPRAGAENAACRTSKVSLFK